MTAPPSSPASATGCAGCAPAAGMTRKILARDSGVSERYLAQLEGGHGNASLLILRQVARALDVPLGALVAGGARAARRADPERPSCSAGSARTGWPRRARCC